MKRIMVCLVVLFLLIGICAVTLKVHGDYTGNITINSDGSISPFGIHFPPTSPILRFGNSTFVFRESISANVTVLMDNAVLDGNGYKVEGNHSSDSDSGVIIQATNVTVENLQLLNCSTAIHIINSTDCTVNMNQIDNCTYGIFIDSSNHTTVSQNNFTGDSPNNSSTVYIGIDIESSENNNITENSFSALSGGISMYSAKQNNIINNTSLDTGDFLEVVDSSNNTFIGNNVTNAETGFNLQKFSINELTTNNTIVQNIITNSMFNVVLGNASGNLFFHNMFMNSTWGVNIFYPNSTFDSWDNGVEGNYWSDYNGTDNNQDGIGDTPYVLHQFTITYQNNIDHYPLMGTFQSFSVHPNKPPYSRFEEIGTISNSTIGNIDVWEAFEATDYRWFLHLTGVVGQEGNTGFCRITFPNDIINSSDYPILINSSFANSTIVGSNGTHTTLYFTFTEPVTEIDVLPEFPSYLILPLFFITTLFAVIFYRKRRKTE